MTLNEQIKIVQREIAYRKKLYPIWIENGKIEKLEADYQIDGMECVLNSLIVLRNFERDIIAKNEKLIKEVK